MNQILQTKLNNKKVKLKKIKFILKTQLYISLSLIIIIGIVIINNKSNLYKQEQYSSKILNNYNITKLYANYISNESVDETSVIGTIEIPTINIYYPVFSNCDDNLLKISPCKLYGPSIGQLGNLCIAGHNYDNTKFFSKIGSLSTNDEIILYNNYNKKFLYYVSDIYEVEFNDLSPIYNYNKKSKLLTLITCNNINNKRIIVKAIQK